MKKVYIHEWACVTNLGFNSRENLGLIQNENNYFAYDQKNRVKVSKVQSGLIEEIYSISNKFQKLDRTSQIALFLANKFKRKPNNFGISIGSSRAATGVFEKYHSEFILSNDKKISPLSSPLTTHGNVSSVVANFLNNDEGLNVEHSVTCSSGVYSILDAMAWINSGLADEFIAGGVEASLTDFTIAQMKALKIYSKTECYPFQNKENSFVLGEGGALFNLSNEKGDAAYCISGFGTAHEKVNSLTDISKDAKHIQKAMIKAVEENYKPDVILAHAPGTLKGDKAELSAIEKVFSKDMPYIYSNKYIHGHTFGASGVLSLALALEILNTQALPTIPYKSIINSNKVPSKIDSILVNTTGFGGNAISLLVEKL